MKPNAVGRAAGQTPNMHPYTHLMSEAGFLRGTILLTQRGAVIMLVGLGPRAACAYKELKLRAEADRSGDRPSKEAGRQSDC